MDCVYKILLDCGFERVNNPTGIVVVHCVPGGGKTSAIRLILAASSRFRAVTFGVAERDNIAGTAIRGAAFEPTSATGELLIVDEYCIGDWRPLRPAVVFGDPCQGVVTEALRPHFIKLRTERFGESTCKLLRSLNFDIHSGKEDIVDFATPYSRDLEGQVIAFGKEAEDLLRKHSVPFKSVCCVRGLTFDVVTLVTGVCCISEADPVELYQCLTRHRKKLLILNPDAALTAN